MGCDFNGLCGRDAALEPSGMASRRPQKSLPIKATAGSANPCAKRPAQLGAPHDRIRVHFALMNAAPLDVTALLATMQSDLRTHLGERLEHIAIVGIHRGGAWVAEALHHALDIERPLGSLNISFYRDDFTRIGLHPQVVPSHLPFEVDGQHLLLVDDVLHTGRTVRAALNEIFDYGRPASISLAALIDRGGRELPIQADVVGARLALESRQHIKLSGPSPLELVITEGKESD